MADLFLWWKEKLKQVFGNDISRFYQKKFEKYLQSNLKVSERIRLEHEIDQICLVLHIQRGKSSLHF